MKAQKNINAQRSIKPTYRPAKLHLKNTRYVMKPLKSKHAYTVRSEGSLSAPLPDTGLSYTQIYFISLTADEDATKLSYAT